MLYCAMKSYILLYYTILYCTLLYSGTRSPAPQDAARTVEHIERKAHEAEAIRDLKGLVFALLQNMLRLLQKGMVVIR